MKSAFLLAVVFASVLANVDARKAYRNRHLTTFEEVCSPTAPPVSPPVPVPVPVPVPAPVSVPVTEPTPEPFIVPAPTGKGGKGGTDLGPTTKSGPVPCPPSGTKSSPSTKSYPGPSPSKSGSSGSSKSGSYSSSKSSGYGSSKSRSGPSNCCGGSSKSGGSSSSKSSSGSSKSRSSPSRSGGGGSSKSSGGSSKRGSGPGCTRLLELAASALGFGSFTKTSAVTPDDENKQEADLIGAVATNTGAPDDSSRNLRVISLKTTFAAFGGYSLPSSFRTSSAVLTFPNLCFSATLDITNFIPSCSGCSFLVTDSGDGTQQTCDPASISVVTPFYDPTEVSFDPYENSTFFDTDSSGSASVFVPTLCTGTGPTDNVERPLLLLDSTGQVAACGILTYVCS